MRAWLAAAAALLMACPAEKADRTLEKLAAERERLAQGGAPAGPPTRAPEPNPLAEVVARNEPPRSLALPPATPVAVGDVTLSLTRAEVMQTLAAGRSTVSTAERFVKVELSASAPRPAPLSLRDATLAWADDSAPLAMDAQRLGHGSPLDLTVQPGEAQPVVLFFEVPPEALAPGARIVLPAGEKKTVELPLQ